MSDYATSSSNVRLVNVKEAAKRLGISKSTLDKMRVYGGWPCYSKLGRAVRYTESDLAAWIANGRRHSTSVLARVS